MPGIPMTFTEDDLKATKLVEPGWYPCEVQDIQSKPSKDGSSMTNHIYLVGLEGDAQGVRFVHYMSEKAMWRRENQNYFRAFGVEPKAGANLDPNPTIGKKLKVYIARGSYNNTPKNEVQDFVPLS